MNLTQQKLDSLLAQLNMAYAKNPVSGLQIALLKAQIKALREMVVFYDKKIRLWTAYKTDDHGNQVGNAGYGPTKELAISDIEVGSCKL